MAFENEYFLLFPSLGPGMVMLQPDDYTSGRAYLSEPLIPGKPLRFSNGLANLMSSVESERVDDMLFDGVTYCVRGPICALIEQHDIAGLQMYPAIFQDSQSRSHKDYFYINLFHGQPFLDRAASELMLTSRGPEAERVFVLRYKFDQAKMRAVPEEQRLIFRLDGVQNATIMVHARLLNDLEQLEATGYRAFHVADFRQGMQN